MPLIDKICERFDSFTFEAMAEEFGNCVCVNTDTEGRYFGEKYAIVTKDEDMCVESEEKLFEKLEELTGKKFESFEQAKSNEDLKAESIFVYKFEPDLAVF